MESDTEELSGPVVITLTLDYSKPIELSAFIGAFSSIGNEYQKSVHTDQNFENEPEIYVREIRSGSIIADLVPFVVSTAPIIAMQAEQVWVAVKFIEKWESRIKSFGAGIVPKNTSKSELANFASAVKAIATDPEASSKLEVATFEDGKKEVRAAFRFANPEAVVAKKTIEAEYRRLDEEQSTDSNRVLMYFTRSDVGDAPKDKRSGEKVVIPEIGRRALPIIYASSLAEEKIKHEIREAHDNIYKKGFSVDVSVVKRAEKPIVYKILAVYEIIDLPDEYLDGD